MEDLNKTDAYGKIFAEPSVEAQALHSTLSAGPTEDLNHLIMLLLAHGLQALEI